MSESMFSFIVFANRNGVDYTAMILKKPEYGYTGPGYSKRFFNFNIFSKFYFLTFKHLKLWSLTAIRNT